MRSTTVRLALVAAILCTAAAGGSDDSVELCRDCTTPTPTTAAPTVTTTSTGLTPTPSLTPSPAGT